MRDLRKNLRQYIDLRRALGYKLRKHESRLTEFIGFLKTHGTDRITTKLAVAWATQSSEGHKHSCCERLRIVRSFARHMSSMDAQTEIPQQAMMRQPETALRPYIYRSEEIGRLMAAALRLFSPRGLRCHTSTLSWEVPDRHCGCYAECGIATSHALPDLLRRGRGLAEVFGHLFGCCIR